MAVGVEVRLDPDDHPGGLGLGGGPLQGRDEGGPGGGVVADVALDSERQEADPHAHRPHRVDPLFGEMVGVGVIGERPGVEGAHGHRADRHAGLSRGVEELAKDGRVAELVVEVGAVAQAAEVDLDPVQLAVLGEGEGAELLPLEQHPVARGDPEPRDRVGRRWPRRAGRTPRPRPRPSRNPVRGMVPAHGRGPLRGPCGTGWPGRACPAVRSSAGPRRPACSVPRAGRRTSRRPA